MLTWLRDRVVLGSFYCTLWEDDYQLVGKRLQYVKRNTLIPSLVITGKMIHEAKARQRERAARRIRVRLPAWEWHYLRVRISVCVPYPARLA